MNQTEPEHEHDQDHDFEALLEYLKRSRGFDFSGYKRSSLHRRMVRRMQAVKVETFADYLDYLEVHPEEFAAVFDSLLINVTNFFRDPGAWEQLEKEVIPRLVAEKPAHDPIRVWCAGCATGEEAYTVAMVLAEAIGPEAYRNRVKIYATDLDEDALAKARSAAYSHREVHGIPLDLLAKYFEPSNHRYVFNKDQRRSIIFGKHDLIQDAPISRVDLLTCRNTLMYFNTETQARVLERFHFALADRGYMLLGKVETLLTYGEMFRPIDGKRRIFAKVPRGNHRDRLPYYAGRPAGDEGEARFPNHIRLREAAFETAALAQVVVDQAGFLVLANERARALFGLTLSDLNRPLQDLELSYKPLELRSLIERATLEKQAVTVRDVEWRPPTPPAEVVCLDVVVRPVAPSNGNGNNHGAVVITITDVTEAKRLRSDLSRTNRQLETAYEELQSTNEELETSNEELQSTIEELETTNEELQSTNEELETMNEELQSTNEELQALNDELQKRSEELNQVNTFLQAILANLRNAVVVVDRDVQVRIWNHVAEDYWGLRGDEVLGKHFLNLDIGLPVQNLRPLIKNSLTGEVDGKEVTLEATNRRGRAIQCRVSCFPLVAKDRGVEGVILLMDEQDGQAARIQD
jgi:two-component system CheB/CheR fusion protein